MKSIIMMHGLPGTGKSYIAEKIKSAFPDSEILKTVSYRVAYGTGARLFDESVKETRQSKDKSYKALCEEAENALKRGRSPILDATFHKRYRREWVYELGRRMDARVIVLSTICPAETAHERIRKRSGNDGEDAFLKSVQSFEIMKSQEDVLRNEEATTVRSEDVEEVIAWLKNIL